MLGKSTYWMLALLSAKAGLFVGYLFLRAFKFSIWSCEKMLSRAIFKPIKSPFLQKLVCRCPILCSIRCRPSNAGEQTWRKLNVFPLETQIAREFLNVVPSDV